MPGGEGGVYRSKSRTSSKSSISVLEFSRSLYLCNHLSESIHSWTKGTLPHPTLPLLPYPTPPNPTHLPLLYPNPYPPTLPTLPYPTLPHPYPPTLPYPTQPMHIIKPVAVELCCNATALIAYAKTKSQMRCLVIMQLISTFVFRSIDSSIPLLPKSEISSL